MASPYTDKIVLVTGASAGMGLATATFLASKGVKAITLMARRQDKLEQVEAVLNQAYPTVQTLVVAGDASQAQDNKRAVEETVAKFGGITSAFINAVSLQSSILQGIIL